MASVSPAAPKSVAPAGESFAALFEESLNRKEMRIGEGNVCAPGRKKGVKPAEDVRGLYYLPHHL